jgi:hypothetical protein
LLPSGDQQGMRLAAMMGLMIEEMGDEEPLGAPDPALRGAAEPHQISPSHFINLGGPARDIGIGLVASGAELAEILDEMIALFDRRSGTARRNGSSTWLSPHRMCTRVPWIEAQKAPFGTRRSTSLSRPAAA